MFIPSSCSFVFQYSTDFIRIHRNALEVTTPLTRPMTRTFVLLHSPFVGPGAWGALTASLASHGSKVVVPDFRDALNAAPPLYFQIARSIVDQMRSAGGTNEIALVAHSGAGALVPAIARRDDRIRSIVFVDAVMPHPGKRWLDIAPPELADRLMALAKGGRLPRWHRWWPKGALEAMVTDKAALSAFIAELHEIPTAYFEEIAPLGGVPSVAKCSYLQLSAPYKAECDEALRRGWRVERLDLHHLAMLTHAGAIESALQSLVTTQ